MNATLDHKDTTTSYTFAIRHQGMDYMAVVYLNESGKFIDTSITSNGDELEYEGIEGQIREDIESYLDENWDKIVA